DHQVFYDRKTRTWASAAHLAFDSWRTAAARLERRPLPGGRGRQRYFQATHEVWARCYAQTVLLRSGDPLLESQLVKLQVDDDPHVWSAGKFEAVAVEVERVFQRLGVTPPTPPLAALTPVGAPSRRTSADRSWLTSGCSSKPYLTIARFAARTSSRRFTGRACGASLSTPGASAASRTIASIASANASRVSFASVSVGSIMSASGTTSGKY